MGNLITKTADDLQQSLGFDNQKMTVKQVAIALGVSDETIRANGKKLFPEIFQNGVKTLFNEAQVTAIKLEVQKHHNLQGTLELVNVKTKLEKALLIKQAMELQQEIIEEQQAEIDVLKPKALEYDLFMNNESTQKIGDVAKTFGLKANTLHQMLRDAKIMKANHVPYEPYEKYFKTVEKPVPGGFNVFTSYLYPSGVSYIAKRFNLQRGA